MAGTPVSRQRIAIGEAMVGDNIITREQLERALRVQQRLEEPKQLGEVMVDLGYISRVELQDAVARYGQHMRLGDMLVEQGVITDETLELALTLQQERGLRLGEALIELGAINERTLLRNIAHQAGVPYVEPTLSMIDPAVLQGVSPEYMLRAQFLPFSRDEEGRTTVVVAELKNDGLIQTLTELLPKGFRLALGPADAIRATLSDLRGFRGEDAHRETVVDLVDTILAGGIDEGASDIHIEPMADKIRVRYRIDGVLVYKTDLPLELLPKLISRIKILAEVNITEHQRHQGGRLIFNNQGREFDMRLSLYVTVHGECAVLRVLNKDMALIDLQDLGMTPGMLQRYRQDVLDLPTGVVLITGPTGSGKTTTLYSSLAYCNDVTRKIITAEDPVEYVIDGLVQCSIYDKVGRTFADTLREVVRQDPDIIVLGEIRDLETAQVAIQAALTGHKVYSTFHTEDTIGGLLRLMDMDIETFLISSTVISVVAQRLLRRVCSQCSVPYQPTAREVQALGLNMREVRQHEYQRGRGCSRCMYTGYKGRVGAYELLILNESVKEAIIAKKMAHEIRQVSIDTTGLVSMREDAIGKVVRGQTTFEEVLKHTPRTFALRPLQQIMALCQ